MSVSHFVILGHRLILAIMQGLEAENIRQLKTDGNHVCGGCTVLSMREGQRRTTKLSFSIAYLPRNLSFATLAGIPRARILLMDTRGSSAISEVGVVAATLHSSVHAHACSHLCNDASLMRTVQGSVETV